MKTLRSLFFSELADRFDSEKQLLEAMPNIERMATCNSLKNLLQFHIEQTKGHVVSLNKVFSLFDEAPQATKCRGIAGLLREGDEIAARFENSAALNAALISAVQKIEHYEIASYGCLHAWALALKNEEAATILQSILTEEIESNKALITLARTHSNAAALGKNRPEKSCCDTKLEYPHSMGSTPPM